MISELRLMREIPKVRFEPLAFPIIVTLFLCDFVLRPIYVMVNALWYLKILFGPHSLEDKNI